MEMTIKQLASELGVSKPTVRSVIAELGFQGKLRKVGNRYMLSDMQISEIKSKMSNKSENEVHSELEKTENFINSEKFMDKRLNLTYDEFSRLLAEFNNLLKLQNLYINFEDLVRSRQLQNKIINILKVYIINKIGEK